MNDEQQEALARLEDIRQELLALAKEALELVRDMDREEGHRAYYTWYAHIVTSVTDDHEFMSKDPTLEGAILGLEQKAEEHAHAERDAADEIRSAQIDAAEMLSEDLEEEWLDNWTDDDEP